VRLAPGISAILLAALVLLPILGFTARADTRAERVRKFQGSLDEQVVRDSGKPLAPEEQTVFTAEAALAAGVVIVILLGVQRLISRIAARRREAETATRYQIENLMTPVAVRDHLARVLKERISFSIWVDDHFIRFSSHADGISDDRKELMMLPLSPAAGNDMLRSSRSVRMEYLYQRVPYHFVCAWAGEDADRGSFMHRLALPESIAFTQRRDVYRVDPPLSAPLTCKTNVDEQEGISVLDLSTGGFALATSNRFRPGEELASFRIEGGTLLPVEGAARCVYELSLSESKTRFRFRYGFEFTRLADGCDRRLLVYISKMQLSDLSRRREMES
jgi:flagellar brake protein